MVGVSMINTNSIEILKKKLLLAAEPLKNIYFLFHLSLPNKTDFSPGNTYFKDPFIIGQGQTTSVFSVVYLMSTHPYHNQIPPLFSVDCLRETLSKWGHVSVCEKGDEK